MKNSTKSYQHYGDSENEDAGQSVLVHIVPETKCECLGFLRPDGRLRPTEVSQ